MGFLDLVGGLFERRRTEHRQLQGLTRQLSAELWEALQAIEFAIGENSWGSLRRDALRIPTWESQSSRLGEGLRPDEWSAVSRAVGSVQMLLEIGEDVTRRIYPNAGGGPAEADQTELEGVARDLEDALLVLRRPSGWDEPADYVELQRELIEKYPNV